MNGMIDPQQAARLRDVIGRADRTGRTQFTVFLDPVACAAFDRMAAAQGLETGRFGGYEDAERCICAAGFEPAAQEEYPIAAVQVQWDARYARLNHPDILGALMGLGLDRARFGDIVMGQSAAYVFALEPAARIITDQLVQAGSATVHAQLCALPQIEKTPGRVVSATFQTLRLDAVAAEALHIPRSQAQALVHQGRVLLNYAPCLKGDARVAPPDVISVRGGGRIVLLQIGGKSKKDRTYLTMEVFARGRVQI